MTLDLILPWFPIILAVGVGSRLLNQVRGMGFGLLGAVFWLALVLATNDPSALAEGWPLVSFSGVRIQPHKHNPSWRKPPHQPSSRSSLRTSRPSFRIPPRSG